MKPIFVCNVLLLISPNVQPAGISTPQISSHLVPAILCTLFCCLPFGIVAIVYAAQVDSKALLGDIAGAQDASSKAALWCWVSFGLGLAAMLVYFLLAVVGVAAGGCGY